MIRPATPEDAAGIDRAHVRAWHRAYADFVNPDGMPDGERDEEERLAEWRRRLAQPGMRTWVHDLDGFVAGFAAAAGAELIALYVDPAAQGAGVGTQLLACAEDALRGAGEASLETFVSNEHGRRFFEARGWRLVAGDEVKVRYGKAL